MSQFLSHSVLLPYLLLIPPPHPPPLPYSPCPPTLSPPHLNCGSRGHTVRHKSSVLPQHPLQSVYGTNVSPPPPPCAVCASQQNSQFSEFIQLFSLLLFNQIEPCTLNRWQRKDSQFRFSNNNLQKIRKKYRYDSVDTDKKKCKAKLL